MKVCYWLKMHRGRSTMIMWCKTGTLQNNKAYQINSDKCGSYLTLSVYLFWIPIVKTPRRTKIIDITKKQNNAQAFLCWPIRPIIFFCRQYFFQEVFVRSYFLVKITPGKVSINFIGDKNFYILLQHSVFFIRPHVIHDGWQNAQPGLFGWLTGTPGQSF